MMVADDRRKAQLLQLFSNITSKTKIVEPMKKIHGSLRDRDAVEREIALVMREVLDQGFFKTKLKPLQLAKLVSDFYAGRNDTEIARDLGDEKLSKTVARARIRLKLFRDLDFRMPFEKQELTDMIDAGLNMKDIADRLNVSPSTLREYRHVLEQEEDHTLDLYLERIKDIMEDRDLTEQMCRSATNDGLGEAIDITEAELAEIS